jgi:hypothetical protein
MLAECFLIFLRFPPFQNMGLQEKYDAGPCLFDFHRERECSRENFEINFCNSFCYLIFRVLHHLLSAKTKNRLFKNNFILGKKLDKKMRNYYSQLKNIIKN